MSDELSSKTEGTLTGRSRRSAAVAAAAGAVFFTSVFIALLTQAMGAEEGGDGEPLRRFTLGLAGVIAALVIMAGCIAVYVGVVVRRRKRGMPLLRAAFPEDTLAFLVERTEIMLGARAPDQWRQLNSSSIQAVAIDDGDVVLLRVGHGLDVLARAAHPDAEVELRRQQIGSYEFAVLAMRLQNEELEVELRFLPAGTTRFTSPPLPDMGAMVAAIRSRLRGG